MIEFWRNSMIVIFVQLEFLRQLELMRSNEGHHHMILKSYDRQQPVPGCQVRNLTTHRTRADHMV